MRKKVKSEIDHNHVDEKSNEVNHPERVEECWQIIKQQGDKLREQQEFIEALTESKNKVEKHLQQLIAFYQYAPSGYLILDRDSVIKDLNKNAATFLEHKIHDLKGEKFQNFLDKSSVPVFDRFLSALFQSEEKINETVILKLEHGKRVSVLIEGIALANKKDCLVDIVDISRRTSVFNQLGECKIGCRSVLEDINEGIAIFNAEGIFTYVNSAGESIFGASARGLRNRKLHDFLKVGPANEFQQKTCKQQKGNRTRYELEITTAEGISKTLAISEAPYYNWKGKLSGTIKMFSDITRQKQDEKEIQRRLKLELTISEISNDFVHLKKEYLDLSVNRALKKIGEFAEVDRSYIFLFSEDGRYCNNTHEWCKPGIDPQIENLQDVPVDDIPWWMDMLNKFETVYIPQVADLPPEAQNEKEILEAQSIQSLLVIPLLTADELIGFLGFDSVTEIKKWKNEDIILLTMLGEILGNGFGRMKYEEKLITINAQLEQKVEERTRDITKLMELNKAIVNNVDLIVISTDQHGIITSMNPYAEKKLGYPANEIIGNYTPLIFHDPQNIFDKTGKKVTEKEINGYNRFDLISWLDIKDNNIDETILISKNGQKINILISSNVLKDENGEIIGYASIGLDITERKKNEMYGFMSRDLGFALAATTTIEQALHQVIQVALKVERVAAAGIYLVNEQTEELELVLHEGLSDRLVQAVKKYKKGQIQFELVKRGEPVYGKYDTIVRVSDSPVVGNELEQIGVIPIRHDGKVIGSLNVAVNHGEKLMYSAKIALEIIASQIGGTLDRINTENALKLSQKNFQQLFETIDDFIFILDNEGRIIKTNPVVERRLGYTKDELAGQSVLSVHPPGRREEAARIVGDMLAGKVEICPVPLYKKNGEIIPVETKVMLGKWDGHDVLYGISRDISERIKAEETLKKSEERWHFALEGSGDGVWDWDMLTNEVYFSKQWKAMLGYSPSEVENNLKEWESRVHPDDLSKCYSDLEKHINGETEIYINEHRIRCKDGRYKWILDRGKIVEKTATGKVARIIGTHTDITPRKLLEEQLLKAIEKEKELNELKSRFVSTTSHEFRTPLASILMVSETLISYQHKMDASQIAARLTKIKEHVMLLTNIVNDVLQLSKIQEGKIGFNPQPEDIVALCKSIIDGFNSSIVTKGQIEFHTNLKKLTVQFDHRIMTQAINNLLSNAVKYTGNEPEILLELKRETDEWTIGVKDNGIGIPEADQKHLFKPFFRASNVSAIQGNGLGLNIVQESVKMHGGSVSFTSELSKGSTFTMHFPLHS